MNPWDGMDTSSSMPEGPGVRKEQRWSHPSARNGEWGWIHTWALLKAESCSDNSWNIPAWFALALPSGISADGKAFPAYLHAAPCSAEAVSHTQPLITLHFPSFAPQSWSKHAQEPSSPLPVLRHTVKGLGHCLHEHCAYIVFTQCWEVLGTPRGHLPGDSRNVPLSHFTEWIWNNIQAWMKIFMVMSLGIATQSCVVPYS